MDPDENELNGIVGHRFVRTCANGRRYEMFEHRGAGATCPSCPMPR